MLFRLAATLLVAITSGCASAPDIFAKPNLVAWCIVPFDADRATMFVSRGVADPLPMRFNCPREVLLLDLVDGDRIR